MTNNKIHDISVVVREHEGDYSFNAAKIPIGESIFNGFHVDWNIHYGTHMDAPYHLTPNSKMLEDYPLERFILPATVVESMDLDSVKLADVETADIKPGSAVLFKTENSRSGKTAMLPFPEPHVCVEPEALQYLFNKGVKLVGFDSSHGERDAADIKDQKNPIHAMMFDNDCIILETVNLRDVKPGDYTLIALPVRLVGGSGSPTRAVLIEK